MYLKPAMTQFEQHGPVLSVISVDEVCQQMCECVVNVYRWANTVSAERGPWECHPNVLPFYFVSISTVMLLWFISLPDISVETWRVIKNIPPPLAIHLLLSISSGWIWVDWRWVLQTCDLHVKVCFCLCICSQHQLYMQLILCFFLNVWSLLDFARGIFNQCSESSCFSSTGGYVCFYCFVRVK